MARKKAPKKAPKPLPKKAAPVRKPAQKAPARRGAARAASPASKSGRLEDVAEAIGIMLPELGARLAALEHMLVETKLCTREDLRRARAFVDMRRSDV